MTFTAKERAVLRLFHTGWSYQTIGEWLGISKDAVRRRVKFAKKRARAENVKHLAAKIKLHPSWLGDADDDFIGRK
jgi:DNA-binding NarL/FixJ family response regulator